MERCASSADKGIPPRGIPRRLGGSRSFCLADKNSLQGVAATVGSVMSDPSKSLRVLNANLQNLHINLETEEKENQRI